MSDVQDVLEWPLPAGELSPLPFYYTTLVDAEADVYLRLEDPGPPRFVTAIPAGTCLPPASGAAAGLLLRTRQPGRLVASASAQGAKRWLIALASATGSEAPDDDMMSPEEFLRQSENSLALIAARSQEREHNSEERALLQVTRQQTRFDDTLADFGHLLDGRFRRNPDGIAPEGLVRAAQALGMQVGIPTPILPEFGEETAADYLERFASVNRLRLRRIDKRDGIPNGEACILGFRSDGTPVLVTRGRFDALVIEDFDSGKRRSALKTLDWDGLQQDLFTTHRTLPDETPTLSSLLRFGLSDLRADIAIMVACALLGSALGILPPLLAAQIANIGVHSGDLTFLGEIMGVLLGVLAAALVFTIIQQLLELRFQGRASLMLHAAMVDRLLRLPPDAVRSSTSLILATQMETVDKLRRSVLSFGAAGFIALANGLTAAILVASISPTAGLVGIALVLALVLGTAFLGWMQFKAIYEGERMDVVVLAFSYDLIRLVPVIRNFRMERTAFTQWGQNFLAFQSRIMRSTRIANRLAIFEGGWEILTLAACFTAVAFASASGRLEAGQAIVFVLALTRMIQAGKSLSHTVLNAAKLLPMTKLAQPFLDQKVEPANLNRAVPRLNGEIEMTGVHFSYSGRAVLNDVSLAIGDGEFVGVTGPSGSGKSTLVRMLVGLERPHSGHVLLDGHDLATLDRRQVARHVAVVMQGAQLFPGTILDNIRGVTDITVDDAWRYADLAGLSEELRAMPMGLNTPVGESGTALAKGQIQRLMIARALAQQPRVIVLDETLSTLDAAGQDRVLEVLAGLGITRIVVSHRPSVLLKSERVIVLEHGRITDSGRASEVMLRQTFLSPAA